MTKDEALKLALEALEVCQQSNYGRDWVWPDTAHPTAMANVKEAIIAIREVLALSESSTKCEETSHAQPDVDRRSTESKETFDQQEPVAITITGKLGNIYSFTGDYSLKKGDKVYTTPPQQEPVIDKSAAVRIATSLGWEPKRTWVGLTDEDVMAIAFNFDLSSLSLVAKAIEAKLKEKNT